MKKISLLFKEISINQIKNSLKEVESVFIVSYSGVSSPNLSTLRQSLRGLNSRLFMVKNSIVRKAFKDAGLDNIIQFIEGPCGLVFIKDESVGVSKLLCDFVRQNQGFKLAGGFLKDRLLKKEDIEALSKLPTKETLRTQVVIAIKSPLTSFVVTLNQILRKFIYCLEQIKQKKEV
ncbi:MAG: 50S ribosomal protein L10 [Candidatus Omnitrophica bacterium]|nr:50S ribosomal protein L10 [Candidatus Omnitrophota bacterium]